MPHATTVDDAAATAESPSGRRVLLRTRGALVAVLVGLGFVAAAWWQLAGSGAPMSVVDEHMHLDTHFTLHDGSYPYPGALMRPEIVEEWACGIGHQGADSMLPCGDPNLGPAALPSGQYSSGYIHYPTYFVGGEAYRAVSEAIGLDDSPVDTYRHYAALVFVLGVAACAVVGWRLRLRGSALVAATFVPVAASGIALFGQTANPNVASVLCGALIAAAGLRWVLHGHGFGWLVAAGALAAITSVTASLPLGAFVLAILAALVGARRGWFATGPWHPRWWHAAVLLAVVALPVLVYGRVIDARATQPNEVLYAFYAPQGPTAIATGAVTEFFVLHSPWFDGGAFVAEPGHRVAAVLRAIGVGQPTLLTVLLFGVLALVTLAWTSTGAREAAASADAPALPDEGADGRLRLLAAATLIGILVYPVALRLSNILTMNVDSGIVPRYSMSFAPLVTLLCLLLCRHHSWYARTLAILGVLGVLSLGATAW